MLNLKKFKKITNSYKFCTNKLTNSLKTHNYTSPECIQKTRVVLMKKLKLSLPTSSIFFTSLDMELDISFNTTWTLTNFSFYKMFLARLRSMSIVYKILLVLGLVNLKSNLTFILHTLQSGWYRMKSTINRFV